MANYLRTYIQTAMQSATVPDILEQAVNLVTNDNLDLGCAVIEKAATEKLWFLSWVLSTDLSPSANIMYQNFVDGT